MKIYSLLIIVLLFVVFFAVKLAPVEKLELFQEDGRPFDGIVVYFKDFLIGDSYINIEDLEGNEIYRKKIEPSIIFDDIELFQDGEKIVVFTGSSDWVFELPRRNVANQ